MQTKFATRFAFMMTAVTFLFASAAFAAGSRISGHLTDAQTGDPLPGGTVLLKGTSLGASTDLNGGYSIQNVPPGSYVIRATYVGYEPIEKKIEVKEGANLVENLHLLAVGVRGKTVVVTAQAAGQNGAINQQLTSNKIVNVVSAAKIQSLPDANAAESVGRLPGISLIRQGGEASEVVIRGLAPQYNQITIDGVVMPANATSQDVGLSTVADAGSRGANLSMISSSMLGGITVTKAITPDMDAAVIGGVVNFKLREAQKSVNGIARVNLTAQGGYNNLQTSFGPYKFVASAENRFLNDRLGVFAEASAERVNLSSNVFGGSYYLKSENLAQGNPTLMSSLNLNDVFRTRQRYGATVTIDYKIPDGKIDFMNFASNSNTSSLNRGIGYSILNDVYSNSTTDSRNYLNVITDLLDFQKSFSFVTVDAKFSHSYSESHDPNDLSVTFRQDNVKGLSTAGNLNPQAVPGVTQVADSANNLYYITNYSNFTRGRNLTGSVDFTSHINFSDLVTSSLKFGGMYRYTIRSFTHAQGDGILDQASGINVRQAIVNAYPWMADPPYNVDPTGAGLIPITVFADPSVSYGKFLDGQYTMGVPTNVGMLWNVLSIVKKSGTLDAYSYDDWASKTYNYSGHEYESAAYVMYTLNVGPTFTFLPGVRYQNLATSYTAPRGIETSTAHLFYNSHDTTMNESHGYFLPMAHLIYRPLTWLQVHLAYTNTLTYPDYRAIIPWIDIGTGSPIPVTWNNYALKPGQSANYDAALSIYDNAIGLFTVDGFLKHITNLIFPVSRYIIDVSQYPGVPQGNTYSGSPVYTYINDPYPIDDYGVELDWQTHLWYLPGPLSGLILSANYTHIFSSARYLQASELWDYSNPRNPGKTEVDTFYTDRLLQQPDDIANLALGYDYGGFSVRVSMIYSSNVFTADEFHSELRSNTATYVRWDLSAKQNLPWSGLQVYFDMNNINGENDISTIQGNGFPSSEQDYGMTADLGVRLSL